MATITLKDLKPGFEYKSNTMGWTYVITKVDEKMVYSEQTNFPKRYTKSGLLKKNVSRLGIEKFIENFDKNYQKIGA